MHARARLWALTAITLALSLVLGLTGVGCQWVFPLHEEEAETAPDGSTFGGASDGQPPSSADAAGRDGGGAAPTDAGSGNDGDAAALSCDGRYTYVQACDDCLNQKCCAEMTACFVTNRAACTGFGNCLASCGFNFVACPDDCRSQFEAGVDDFGRANLCSNNACGSVCSSDAGH